MAGRDSRSVPVATTSVPPGPTPAPLSPTSRPLNRRSTGPVPRHRTPDLHPDPPRTPDPTPTPPAPGPAATSPVVVTTAEVLRRSQTTLGSGPLPRLVTRLRSRHRSRHLPGPPASLRSHDGGVADAAIPLCLAVPSSQVASTQPREHRGVPGMPLDWRSTSVALSGPYFLRHSRGQRIFDIAVTDANGRTDKESSGRAGLSAPYRTGRRDLAGRRVRGRYLALTAKQARRVLIRGGPRPPCSPA